jgi:thiol:disulfide interchange protein DsbC
MANSSCVPKRAVSISQLAINCLVLAIYAFGSSSTAQVKVKANSVASKAVPSKADMDVITEALKKRVPQLQIEDIRTTQLPGIYEVLTSEQVVYSDARGDFLFLGKLVKTEPLEDLTAKRWEEAQRVDFKKLPFEKAIKIVKGNGSRKLAFFADPQCPYCVRFQKSLDQVNDLTAYLFLFPIEELHPGAGVVAENIWCATDPAAAWSKWILEKVEPEKKSCGTQVLSDVQAMADKFKINGTPTVFFQDGNRIPGAVSTEELEGLLTTHSIPN